MQILGYVIGFILILAVIFIPICLVAFGVPFLLILLFRLLRGILYCFLNLFTKKKINPLIGATGLSAVPMASRVANDIALKYDPKNHVLQYCMASNISGVIGSAVAAGVLISFLS